jgi:hypothetical protein
MTYVYNDGGRADAGFKGDCGDCVTRAIAISSQLPYRDIYDELSRRKRKLWFDLTAKGKQPRGRPSARTGMPRKVYEPYLRELGFTWTPTMGIGTGCRVHLKADELPQGRLVCRVSKHMVAVIDGVVHDTHDPSRGGTRCCYGYWTAP